MKRILVIEDNRAMREELVSILGFEGFDVLDAQDGQIGLRVAAGQRPDLILCDVMMPNLDGYETLEAVRADPSTAELPFVFLSAKATPEDRERGIALGANAYLTKPFSAGSIVATINQLLGSDAAAP